jgi:hypothetical protein
MTEKEPCTIWKKVDPRTIVEATENPQLFDGECMGCDACAKAVQNIFQEIRRIGGHLIIKDSFPAPDSQVREAERCLEKKKEIV